MTEEIPASDATFIDDILLNHVTSLEATSGALVKELREERQWRRFAKIALGIAFTAIIVLGYFCFVVLSAIREGQQEDRVSGRDFRRALADCTVKPGVILDDGYVNPGVCFSEGQIRSREAIAGAVTGITEEIRKLLMAQAEATAANRNLSREVRSIANEQLRALRNLAPPTTARPPATTPTVTTTTTVRPPPPAPPAERGLVCDLLSIVGLCGSG